MTKSAVRYGLSLLVVGFLLGLGASALAKEAHPEIRQAQSLLERAKDRLQHAAHDFQGHRVKAIQHIDEAQDELRLALQSDKD